MPKNRTLLLFSLLLLLFAGSSFAALDCETEYTKVGAISFTDAKYETACMKFVWAHSQTTNDFNNYVYHYTDSEGSSQDYNTQAKQLTLCSYEPGESVTLYVRAYDGNAAGMFCSYDYNVTVGSGSIYGAGRYMVYTIFTVFAAIVGIIIFVGVLLIAIKKMDLKIPLMKK